MDAELQRLAAAARDRNRWLIWLLGERRATAVALATVARKLAGPAVSNAPVKRYSGRLTLYFVIATCAVLAAVIIGRLEPLVAVAPFVAAILTALFSEGAPRAPHQLRGDSGRRTRG